MMKKAMVMMMAVVLAFGCLTGCGSKEENTPSAPAAETEESETEAPKENTEDASTASANTDTEGLLNGHLVVYIANEAASDWQIISTEYLKALVESAGGTCQIMNPENDASRQAQMVEDALVLTPSALVIKPIDQAAIVPALQKANEAGIPIITLDTGLIENAGVDVACAIQTDQTSLGETAAKYVEKAATEGGYTANVITVLGDMSSNIAQLRQSGFNDYAETTDNVKVLAETESKWDPSAAYTAVMDMMTANPEANTIFCCADCMMSGVIQALGELDRLAPAGDEKHVTIVGIDADPNGCSYVEQGYVDQESEHNAALHSDIAYKVIVDMVNGYEIPETIFFDTTARTADNIQEAWGNMDVKNVANWGVMEQDAYVMQTPVQ